MFFFKKELFKDLVRYSTIGFEFVICVLIGIILGYLIDKNFIYTKPWATILFLIFGFLAGFKRLIYIGEELKKRNGRDRKN